MDNIFTSSSFFPIKISELLAVVISLCAAIVAYLSYKRIKDIDKPTFQNIQYDGATYHIILNDYSNGHNLHCKSVMVKPRNKYFYKKISYTSELMNNGMPSQIGIIVPALSLFTVYKFKIITNYGTINCKNAPN